MGQYEYSICLRFHHPNIDPDVITAHIGTKPRFTCKVGNPRVTQSGRPLKGTYKDSFWVGELLGDPWKQSNDLTLEDCIRTYMKSLEPRAEFIKKIIAEGGKAELFIGILAKEYYGLSFDTELLKELSGIGVSLEICIYSKSGDDDKLKSAT